MAKMAKPKCNLNKDFLKTVGESWMTALKSEFDAPYFDDLCRKLEREYEEKTVYPPKESVFAWTQHCAIEDVKVVILGQDPYPGEGKAHGLSFSVKYPTKPPQSLNNIFNAMESDASLLPPFKRPTHGDLTGWAKKGVLLLNTTLTVRAHEPNSHANLGWQNFTDAVIKYLGSDENLPGRRVFMFWGDYAIYIDGKNKTRERSKELIDTTKHKVLTCFHPGNQSAYKGFYNKDDPSLRCKHFSEANAFLKTEIDWNYLPSPPYAQQ